MTPVRPRINGIEVGPGSPLLTAGGRPRVTAPDEASEQAALMALLIGPALPGEPRAPGAGMTHRHPELSLIYAINPNKGGNNSKAARGRGKAMGGLAGMPDLCLPVMRGPFLALYLEVKRTKASTVTRSQVDLHALLRTAGNCVMAGRGTEACLQIVLGYLALPPNRPSVRPIAGRVTGTALDEARTLAEKLVVWRTQSYEMLKPKV